MMQSTIIRISPLFLLAGCAAQNVAVAPQGASAAPSAMTPARPVVLGLDDPAPDTMRWTYGSGEAAGASIQAWRALADYAIAAAARKPGTSVALGLPDAPGGIATTSCQSKKPAVVVDVDETVILNRGLEYWLARGNPNSGTVFDQWTETGASAVAPVPGAVTGIRRLRAAGIAVIYNTNRDAKGAAGTIRALEAAGVGSAVHGQDLFLLGDDELNGNKDGRRRTISERFCVLALGGDNLGDFAHALNDPAQSVQQRRDRSARGDIAQLWGNGWFMIPNAAYGFWQKGTIGEVFPPDARWEPGAPAIMTRAK
jgi:5'-nucleotidase (lipoprotein e(P4) family)